METHTPLRTIDKVVCLGTSAETEKLVFVHIKYDGQRLSISGVDGPENNGDCYGSCGQIVGLKISKPHRIFYPHPFTQSTIDRLYEVWKRWHLNDMRPGCEHQRDWDTTEKLEIITYRLDTRAFMRIRTVKEAIIKAATDGVPFELYESDRALLQAPMEVHALPEEGSLLTDVYKEVKREQKAAGWVYPTEHPQGLLTKPCPECGYKYGSAWLFEPVPDNVLHFLESLPDTDKKPAWV